MSNIPMVDKLDKDPVQMIKTGDWVEINADQATVTVKHR